MLRFPLALLKAALRWKRLTLQLLKLRWFLLKIPTCDAEVKVMCRLIYLFNVINLFLMQAFMYGEEEPDIDYWKQLAEKRRYFQPFS